MGGLSKEGSDGSGVLAEGQQEPQRTTRAGLEGWTSEAPAGQEPWRTTRAGLEGWTKRAPAHLESQQRDREVGRAGLGRQQGQSAWVEMAGCSSRAEPAWQEARSLGCFRMVFGLGAGSGTASGPFGTKEDFSSSVL